MMRRSASSSCSSSPTILVVAAFSTALPFLFYLLYLAILVIGGSYVLVRLGLSDLEAGYAVSQLHGHVGDRMRVTYTLRNTSRIPKLWLEVHNPTTLPGGLPGRAITLGGRARALVADPRAARPGAATSGSSRSTSGPATRSASSRRRRRSGRASRVVVYPRLEPLPRWRLPGGRARGQPRLARANPPDDAAGDDRPAVRAGRRDEPDPLEDDGPPRRDPGQGVRPRADRRRVDHPRPPARRSRPAAATSRRSRRRVRAAASIADKALSENRAVGMTVNVGRTAFLPADRGGRQHLKIMQLLAAVEADGSAPLVETLIASVGRLRRGMTAVIITASLDPSWVRPLASLRARGVACVVVTLDARRVRRSTRRRATATADGEPSPSSTRRPTSWPPSAARPCATPWPSTSCRPTSITPGRPLGEILAR